MPEKLKLSRFDAAEFFADAEAQAQLLSDAFASSNATYITNTLNIIARARGMGDLAKETGLTEARFMMR